HARWVGRGAKVVERRRRRRRRRIASKPPLELCAYHLAADARMPATSESNDLRERGFVRIAKEKAPRSLQRCLLAVHCHSAKIQTSVTFRRSRQHLQR